MDDVESFIPDRSLYELGDQDLKELWDSENFEMSLAESSSNNETEYVWYDTEEEFRSVILNDRMMTDAALPGGPPIKHEHSYSLAGRNNKRSYSPELHSTRYDDMDIECYPVISMRPSGEGSSCKSRKVIVKAEPADPDSTPIHDKTTRVPVKHSSGPQSLLKHKTLLISPSMSTSSKLAAPKINIKVEPDSSSYSLPPTPPSSYNSDSEGSLSPLHSSADSQNRSLRGVSINSCQATANSNRHPISTPLISSQPKGASGMLILTEEEKRTLIAEGYPVPTKLPLTKAEERSLKKIRRKIKNKISAQESRRKKKEYMDLLERKVEFLASENLEYRKQVNTLESLNNNLQDELERLRCKLELSSKADTKATQTLKIEAPDYSMFPENIVSVSM